MRESYWGYAVIVLGIIAITTMWFISNVTRTDQNNYNVLKETVEAAMLDAVDLAYYRENHIIRMDDDNFVESFIRRFSENADLSNEYVVEIYDINDVPPKVSLRVTTTKTSNRVDDDTGKLIEVDITNNIDAILENKFRTVDYTNSTKICDSSNHCVISVDYLTNVGIDDGSNFVAWIAYPNSLALPDSIRNGHENEILHSYIIAARWKNKNITIEDLVEREKTICDKYLGHGNATKQYIEFTDEQCANARATTADNINIATVQTSTTYLKVQPFVSNMHMGADNLIGISFEAYYEKDSSKKSVANWITIDWEYWFEKS